MKEQPRLRSKMKLSLKQILALMLMTVLMSGCDKAKDLFKNLTENKSDKPKAQQEVPSYKNIQIANVIKVDIGQGQGPEVLESQQVAIYWDAWIYDPAAPMNKGKKIYGMDISGKPQIITVGKSEIMPGVDRGILGMKASGKRQLIVPTELAYGENGSGEVPGGAIILVEITLVDILNM